jgi:hypothetical protein
MRIKIGWMDGWMGLGFLDIDAFGFIMISPLLLFWHSLVWCLDWDTGMLGCWDGCWFASAAATTGFYKLWM